MMALSSILAEIKQENGSNYKLSVLRKYKDHALLNRVLQMTYDKVTWTYSVKKILIPERADGLITLSNFLDFLERKIVTREVTGHNALNLIKTQMNLLSAADQGIAVGIFNRDLRLNLGRATINKVWPNLIVKPPYMRCGVYSEKTASKINFPAIIELKADGTFRYVIKEDDKITFMSRSGEESNYPILEAEFKNDMFLNGVYVGEMLVANCETRQKSNGLINSDNPPHEDIILQCWDFISLEEFADAKHQRNIPRTPYSTRFTKLRGMIYNYTGINLQSHVSEIPNRLVNNIQEALNVCSQWMNEGFEGAVLKDINNIFKDHTSPTQLKLKLEIDADVRITGFSEGTPGTKREKTFGAIMYENDEGTVKGQCSGFTDQQLEDFNSRRSELIGKVMTVQFNDLTRAKNSETYALNHPRFIELRNDKNETDTLERLFELKNMAMQLS
jgi:hypothetical protein